MENNIENLVTNNSPSQSVASTNAEMEMTRQMLEEILEQTRKTKNYMKWQLIITVAFVILPLIGTIAIVPYAMKTFSSVYSIDGLGDQVQQQSGGLLDQVNQLRDLTK